MAHWDYKRCGCGAINKVNSTCDNCAKKKREQLSSTQRNEFQGRIDKLSMQIHSLLLVGSVAESVQNISELIQSSFDSKQLKFRYTDNISVEDLSNITYDLIIRTDYDVSVTKKYLSYYLDM